MEKKDIQKDVEERLKSIENAYGTIPFIFKVIADQPDLFIAYSDFIKNLMLEPKHIDMKTLELAAIAAGSALGADHCLDIHLQQARNNGATDGEIFEVIMVGCFMAMTNDQAHALRRFSEMQKKV